MSSSRAVELIQQLAETTAALRESYASILSVASEIRDADIAHLPGYSQLMTLIDDVAAEIDQQQATRLPVDREALTNGALDLDPIEAILRAAEKIESQP